MLLIEKVLSDARLMQLIQKSENFKFTGLILTTVNIALAGMRVFF